MGDVRDWGYWAAREMALLVLPIRLKSTNSMAGPIGAALATRASESQFVTGLGRRGADSSREKQPWQGRDEQTEQEGGGLYPRCSRYKVS